MCGLGSGGDITGNQDFIVSAITSILMYSTIALSSGDYKVYEAGERHKQAKL